MTTTLAREALAQHTRTEPSVCAERPAEATNLNRAPRVQTTRTVNSTDLPLMGKALAIPTNAAAMRNNGEAHHTSAINMP